MITVTYVDDTTAEFPSAETWMLLRGTPGTPHPPTFTADVELRDAEREPVAIIGAGTFKSIEKSTPAPA